MNLNLIPYRLCTAFEQVANQITYVDTYNAVKLYRMKERTSLLTGIPLTDVHLYFHEEMLITLYLHLENNLDHVDALVKEFTLEIGTQGFLSRSQFGFRYKWEMDGEVLVLVKDQIHRKFYVYYALDKFSVY